LARVIRDHIFRKEFEAVAALLAHPKTATLAARVIANEAGRWERALVARAEGASERRARRIARQARKAAAEQCKVELRTGAPDEGSSIGIAGDFDDGSGDYIRLPDSLEDKAEGFTPLVVRKLDGGGYAIESGQVGVTK
jgi:hypothetical protein